MWCSIIPTTQWLIIIDRYQPNITLFFVWIYILIRWMFAQLISVSFCWTSTLLQRIGLYLWRPRWGIILFKLLIPTQYLPKGCTFLPTEIWKMIFHHVHIIFGIVFQSFICMLNKWKYRRIYQILILRLVTLVENDGNFKMKL